MGNLKPPCWMRFFPHDETIGTVEPLTSAWRMKPLVFVDLDTKNMNWSKKWRKKCTDLPIKYPSIPQLHPFPAPKTKTTPPKASAVAARTTRTPPVRGLEWNRIPYVQPSLEVINKFYPLVI